MTSPVLPCLAAALLVAMPALGQQGCPTAADLARGIRIDYLNGGSEVFRDRGDGVITVSGRDASGAGYQFELAQGLYLLGYATEVNGQADPASRVSYDYGMRPDDLPPPAPLGRHRLSVTPSNTQESWDEAQTHAYGDMTSVLIGGCTYDMFPAVILYETDTFYTEGLNFLPDLGFGYLLWTETSEAARSPNDAIGIRAVTK